MHPFLARQADLIPRGRHDQAASRRSGRGDRLIRLRPAVRGMARTPGRPESLLDRIINTSHQVFINGPSSRPTKRPGRVVPPRRRTSGKTDTSQGLGNYMSTRCQPEFFRQPNMLLYRLLHGDILSYKMI